jgi:hypothetical protein
VRPSGEADCRRRKPRSRATPRVTPSPSTPAIAAISPAFPAAGSPSPPKRASS